MKRFLSAAALALAFHGLLFTVKFEGLGAKPILLPQPLTVSLDREPSDPLPSLAVSETVEAPESPPHRSEVREEKPRSEKVRKPGKSPRRMDSPVQPQQDQAMPSTGGHNQGAEELPGASPSREFPHSATASLGQGGPNAKLPSVHEAVPLYRTNPVPEYPLSARRRGFHGTVVLEVLVDREGRVADLRLFSSSGYAVLDQSAWASVKTWLFDPGTRGGERVDMWVKVPVRFHLE